MISRTSAQQPRMDRRGWRDELLVVLRQQVGLLVAEAGEVAAEVLPQPAGAVGLQRRQQLGQHLIAEHRAVHADEQEPHVRQRLAQRLGVAAVLGQQDQAADLRRAVVVVADAQRAMDEVAIERVRVALVVLDAEEDVRRALGAVLGVDHRRADDPALAEILEDEQVLAIDRRHAGGERLLRQLEDALDVPAIGGQVDGVEVLRDRQDLLGILSR
jgi:hypothetical protein